MTNSKTEKVLVFILALGALCLGPAVIFGLFNQMRLAMYFLSAAISFITLAVLIVAISVLIKLVKGRPLI